MAPRGTARAVSLSLEFMTLLHTKVSLRDDAGNENRLIQERRLRKHLCINTGEEAEETLSVIIQGRRLKKHFLF